MLNKYNGELFPTAAGSGVVCLWVQGAVTSYIPKQRALPMCYQYCSLRDHPISLGGYADDFH